MLCTWFICDNPTYKTNLFEHYCNAAKTDRGKERGRGRGGEREREANYIAIGKKSDLEENVERNDDGDDSGYKEHLLLLGTHTHTYTLTRITTHINQLYGQMKQQQQQQIKDGCQTILNSLQYVKCMYTHSTYLICAMM